VARTRKGLQRPTVADVARLAGVSAMTVSRVVNREPSVLSATREKVQSAIATLGYEPNQAARALAGGRDCRIALLHSNPSSAYLSELLMGCLAEINASDAQLTVEYADEDTSARELVHKLQAHRADAVLLPPPLCDNPELLQEIHRAGLLIAQVATARPLPFAFAVTIADEDAARSMTEHLVARGHERIGFIGGNSNQTASALRERGYRLALGNAGLPVTEALIAQGDFTYRSGLAAAERLLAANPRPTAIFASNDDMAAAAVMIAHRHGLDVPADISICGYDDTAIATTVWPELTTVRQPIREMAARAAQLLIAGVDAHHRERPVEFRHVRLDYEIRVRDSG
jgi:LacI family transcriptional regulator